MLLFEKIESLKKEISLYPKLGDVEEERIRENFMINYTYNSNAIEGNTLTLAETAMVILEGITIDKKPLREHLEVVGHKDAFNYIIMLSKDIAPLSEKAIKDIHNLVLIDKPEYRGIYRKIPVLIGGASHIPPSPMQIPLLMKELLEQYRNDNRHPIEKIADFHVRFERIHPFADGNGRSGRLILNLELIKAGYQPVDIKFTDRARYIKALDSYDQDKNAFISMVAEYQLQELESLLNILKEREAVIEHRMLAGYEKDVCKKDRERFLKKQNSGGEE